MSRKLVDQMALDLYSVFLNTDEHAQTIYYGKAGQLSDVVAIVERHEKGEIQQGYEFQRDGITVLVGDDPDHDKGGVETPEVNRTTPDVIRLTDCETADLYEVTGNSIDDSTGGWLIHAECIKAKSIGSTKLPNWR